MASAYKHSPLPCQRSVRLLNLLPGDGPISCEILITEEKWPSYYALSYTWGDPDDLVLATDKEKSSDFQFIIQCEGKTIQVTENAYHALEQLRSLDQEDSDDEEGPSYLWVDSICIDQSNIQERNTQVAMMGDIYAAAAGVLIWLGNSSSETTEAISLITTFGSALTGYMDDNQQELPTDLSKLPFDDKALYEKLGIAPFSLRQWHSILRFFSRRWFTRGWVFQEFVLAKEAIVLCGKEKLEIDPLMYFAVFTISSGWIQGMATIKACSTPSGWTKDYRSFDFNVRETQGIQSFCAAISFRFRRKHGLEDRGYRQLLQDIFLANSPEQRLYGMFQHIICTTGAYRVTDLRDKIFIPLALTSYYVRLNEPLHFEWLLPDYNMTTEDTYITASSLLLRNSCTLSLLSLVGGEQTTATHTLPSWVPDYSHSNNVGPLIFFPHFHATRHWHLVTPVAEHLVPTNLLKIVGYIPDSIASLTRPLEDILGDHAVWEWIDLVSLLPSEYQDYVEALWRTLVCDQDPIWDGKYEENRPNAREELGLSFKNFVLSEMSMALLTFTMDNNAGEDFWNQKGAYTRLAALPGSLLPDKDEITRASATLAVMSSGGPPFLLPPARRCGTHQSIPRYFGACGGIKETLSDTSRLPRSCTSFKPGWRCCELPQWRSYPIYTEGNE